MIARLKGGLAKLWQDAVVLNEQNIVRLARSRAPATPAMCDLGCGDGRVTAMVARASGATSIAAVEGFDDPRAMLADLPFEIRRDDLNGRLEIASDTFDLVMSNQVIEHLYDTELFLDECVRIAKPGGTVIVSTENPAAWHNIAALAIGWQPFSLANVSTRRVGVGNPLSLAPAQDGWPFPMQHHRLFTPRALLECMALAGLTDLEVTGAGYHPLPAKLGRLDATHAHFITAAGRKP